MRENRLKGEEKREHSTSAGKQSPTARFQSDLARATGGSVVNQRRKGDILL